jgi:hypothetical protein
LVKGYGPHLADLSTAEDLETWFRFRRANLAVVCPPSAVILDFDLIDVYKLFCKSSPEASRSYTEETPRGGRHVFLVGLGDHTPNFVDVMPGLEIKSFAVVYPSAVDGRQYRPELSAPILTLDLEKALRGFAKVNHPSSAKAPGLGFPGGKFPPSSTTSSNRGIMARVKQSWPILVYLAVFEPKVKLAGNGRFRSALCPWHKDTNPSMYVDTERNLWKCHSCEAHGDIVNWHALRLGVDQLRAAQDLDNHTVPGGDPDYLGQVWRGQ